MPKALNAGSPVSGIVGGYGTFGKWDLAGLNESLGDEP